MNFLYTSHIHKDYSVYHAFMHTVKSSCHASLTEQSGLLRLQEHFFCAAKSLSMEEQFCCIQKLVLDVLSFCVYIVEEIYMFKQSSAVLKLFCPHIDVFCINNYKCSDDYHFLQVDQYIQLFCKEYVIILWEFPTQIEVKESG